MKIYPMIFFCVALVGYCESAPRLDMPGALLLVTVADSGQRSLQRGYHRPGYRPSPAAANAVAGIEHDYALQQIDGWPIRILGIYCVVMAAATDVDLPAMLAQLNRDARVSLAQPLQMFDVRADNIADEYKSTSTYNDPYYSLQYGKYTTQLEQWHRHATGRGVHVAMVDTGVDRNHPDLQQHIREAQNFVDGNHQFDNDIHGTAVAGIIAASANNGIGIVGLAPDADLLVLKACWQLNNGEIAARCNSFTLAKALSFAIEHDADIINLSLGGPADPLLTQLLQLALQRGTLVIAAQSRRDEFPTNVPGVIGVKAAVDSDLMAWAVVKGSMVVEAQASELLSTSPGGHYDFFSGSSMAAARVTGLSALMRQEQQNLSATQMLENLNRWLAEPPTVAQLQ